MNREDRFWANVIFYGDDDCWEWGRGKFDNGYGIFYWDRRKASLAHRCAFYFANGYWPKTVEHDCENKSCVNPLHLLDGSMLSNNETRVGWKDGKCKRGHDLSKSIATTRTPKGVRRYCRECVYEPRRRNNSEN